MKELLAAAKRLLSPSAPQSLNAEDMWEVARAMRRDYESLARHVLSTVREDDGEAVTNDASYDLPGGQVVNVHPWAIRINGYTLKEHPTRGDVRNLCRALGIQLNETETRTP